MPVHRQELHAADLLLLLGFLEVCLQHAQGNVPEVVHWKKTNVNSSQEQQDYRASLLHQQHLIR